MRLFLQSLVKRYMSAAAVMAEKSETLEKPIAIHLPNETTALQQQRPCSRPLTLLLLSEADTQMLWWEPDTFPHETRAFSDFYCVGLLMLLNPSVYEAFL